jgi:hypothetical protein
VFRYLGYVLVVVATVGLGAGLAVALLVDLERRVALDRGLRLTALDAIAPQDARWVRAAAVLHDRRTGHAVPRTVLVFRFSDGWGRGGWAGDTGLGSCRRPGPLAVGGYPYEVTLPEEWPLLGVRSGATVWVRPAGVPVVWVDAAAVGVAAPGDQPAGQAGGAAEALKGLASRYQVVYLVAGDLDRYAAQRERAAALAPGPAVWIGPGAGASRLAAVRAVWPKVAAALAAGPEFRDEAAACGVPVLTVPRAGDASDEGAGLWREVGRRLR